MSITTYPHEGPQWENVYHLLDLSKSNVSTWCWSERFGFYPAVLVTIEVEEAQHVTDDYPEKEKHPRDRIATVDALKRSIQNCGLSPDQPSAFFEALLVRFSFRGNILTFNEHQLAHFSVNAAHFIHENLSPRIVAVQAPSVDRAVCSGCDVHRILFGLETHPPQKLLREGQKISELIIGENFQFGKHIPDGRYIFQANGVDFAGQDVTISTSYLYYLND